MAYYKKIWICFFIFQNLPWQLRNQLVSTPPLIATVVHCQILRLLIVDQEGNLSSYKLQPTPDCLHICIISEDNPSEISIMAVGLISTKVYSSVRTSLPSGFNWRSINKYKHLNRVENWVY
jgi:hypothetical protein